MPTGKTRARGKPHVKPENPATPATAGGADDARDGGGPNSPADRLAELLEQFSGGGAGYRAYVERLHDDAEPEYLGAVAFDESFYDTVRAAYGGGRFSARIIEGKKYRGRVPPFRIGGKPRDDAAEPTKPASAEPPPPSLPELIAAAFKPYADRIEAISTRLASPPPDPIANAVALVQAFRSIAGPVATSAPAVDGGSLGMFNSFLELQDRLAERMPRPSATSGVADAIREVAPLLSKAFEANNQAPGADVVSPRATNRPTEPQSPAPIVAGWLAPFVGWNRQLLAIADTGRDPALYAAVFNDSLDESTAAQLVAAINAGTIVPDIFAAFPELNASAERRIFAGKLVKALEELFEDETEPASSSAEAPAA